MKYIGLDPSFAGFGIAIIDKDNKKIIVDEFGVKCGNGKFIAITEASIKVVAMLLMGYKEVLSSNCMIAQEIPPTQGFFAVKLWALGSLLYRTLPIKPFCFSTSYLRYIHEKKNSKDDTILLMNDIIEVFKCYGYELENKVYKKLSSNEADAMLYAVRMYIKDSGESDEIRNKILEIKSRYIENKEEFYDIT